MHKNNKLIAFILHPLNVSEFQRKAYFYAPFDSIIRFFLKKISPFEIKSFFSKLPPHVFLHEKGIDLTAKNAVDLIFVMCPLFPDELMTKKEESFNKVLAAVKLCKRKGADVIVLGGFTSIATDQGKQIQDILGNSSLIITSGNTLTAAFCCEKIKAAAKIFGTKIEDSRIAVLGAAGDIGSACSIFFSKIAKEVVLVSRNISVESKIFDKILSNKKSLIKIEKNIDSAIKEADIVLAATSSYVPIIQVEKLKSGSLVCDVSLPHNIPLAGLNRDDIFVFNGGMGKIKTGKKFSRKLDAFSFSKNIIPGCLAEGIVLALLSEKKDFMLGRGNISEENMLYMLQKASDLNIMPSDFFFYDHFYSEVDFGRKALQTR